MARRARTFTPVLALAGVLLAACSPKEDTGASAPAPGRHATPAASPRARLKVTVRALGLNGEPPVPGARVEAAGVVWTTDSEGTAAGDVPPGPHEVTASLPGSNASARAQASAVPGRETEVRLSLPAALRLRGTVRGAPAGPLKARVLDKGRVLQGSPFLIGAGGRFDFIIAPALTTVTLELAGKFTLSVDTDGRSELDDVDFDLEDGVRVDGRVVSQGGAPLAGARVTCGDASATSDSGGRFSLTGLRSGVLALAVSRPGYLPGEREISVGTPSGRVRVSVPLAAAPYVRGRLSGPTRHAFGTGEVSLAREDVPSDRRQEGKDVLHVKTDASGLFEFADVSALSGGDDSARLVLSASTLSNHSDWSGYANVWRRVRPNTDHKIELVRGGTFYVNLVTPDRCPAGTSRPLRIVPAFQPEGVAPSMGPDGSTGQAWCGKGGRIDGLADGVYRVSVSACSRHPALTSVDVAVVGGLQIFLSCDSTTSPQRLVVQTIYYQGTLEEIAPRLRGLAAAGRRADVIAIVEAWRASPSIGKAFQGRLDPLLEELRRN